MEIVWVTSTAIKQQRAAVKCAVSIKRAQRTEIRLEF